MGISSLWLVLVGLLVQWNLSSSQCILELSIWNEGVGCNGQADVTITIVANGQCNVDRADEGPGNYIATCDSDGLLFLSSSCIDADCAPPEQDDFFSQGKCDRDSSATAYLYTNDDTPIPLNSCQSLHRTYPPNRVSIMVAGDCTICTEAPSVAPSALSTMAPTNTTSTPSSVPTLDPTAVPSLDSSLAISSMPSDQPSLSPTSVIVVEPPPAPLTQPPVEPPSNNIVPSSIPSQLTNRPSLRPTADAPTSTPVVVTSASAAPSSQPRSAPRPTRRPTRQPTMAPTITAAAPSNAALGESSSTTTTTTNATDTCLLINTNRCESLLSATATVIEEKSALFLKSIPRIMHLLSHPSFEPQMRLLHVL